MPGQASCTFGLTRLFMFCCSCTIEIDSVPAPFSAFARSCMICRASIEIACISAEQQRLTASGTGGYKRRTSHHVAVPQPAERCPMRAPEPHVRTVAARAAVGAVVLLMLAPSPLVGVARADVPPGLVNPPNRPMQTQHA